MPFELVKTFRFEAAHHLPETPEGHKCRRPHGHGYRVDIHVTGEPDQSGWVVDFGVIKQAVGPVMDELDHRYLNEIEGLENPTAENMAKYIYDKVAPEVPQIAAVTVWESDTSRCTYRK